MLNSLHCSINLERSDRRQDRHLIEKQRSAFVAFKLVLRSSDYFQTIGDGAKITYIVVPNFVSSSDFKTTTGEGV